MKGLLSIAGRCDSFRTRFSVDRWRARSVQYMFGVDRWGAIPVQCLLQCRSLESGIRSVSVAVSISGERDPFSVRSLSIAGERDHFSGSSVSIAGRCDLSDVRSPLGSTIRCPSSVCGDR